MNSEPKTITIKQYWNIDKLRKKIDEVIPLNEKLTLEFIDVEFNDKLITTITPLFENDLVNNIEFMGNVDEYYNLSFLINKCSYGVNVYFEYGYDMYIMHGCSKVNKIYIRNGMLSHLPELIANVFNVKRIEVYENTYTNEREVGAITEALRGKTITEFEFEVYQFQDYYNEDTRDTIMGELDDVLDNNKNIKEEVITQVYNPRERVRKNISIPVTKHNSKHNTKHVDKNYNPCTEIPLESYGPCSISMN